MNPNLPLYILIGIGIWTILSLIMCFVNLGIGLSMFLALCVAAALFLNYGAIWCAGYDTFTACNKVIFALPKITLQDVLLCVGIIVFLVLSIPILSWIEEQKSKIAQDDVTAELRKQNHDWAINDYQERGGKIIQDDERAIVVKTKHSIMANR